MMASYTSDQIVDSRPIGKITDNEQLDLRRFQHDATRDLEQMLAVSS